MARVTTRNRYPSPVLLHSLERVTGGKPPERVPVGPSGPAVSESRTHRGPAFAGPGRETMQNDHIRRQHEGEHVTATEHGGTRISGRIEATVPHLNAAWIREDGLGARHLITVQDLLEDEDTPLD